MRIGIDLGGTKTEIICLHADNGKELYRHRVPTPQNDYQGTIKNIANLVNQAEQTLGKKGTVGIGIPGTVSSVTGLVKNANSTWLNGQALDKNLEELLGRPVRAQNDANCLAVSEATDGAGAGKDCVFAVIIGTGCGAGIAINGRTHAGLNGIGGEWGHNPLPSPKIALQDHAAFEEIYADTIDAVVEGSVYAKKQRPDYFMDTMDWNEYPGPQCYCGKKGCIETWISGTGFKKDYKRVTGNDLSTHDIIAAAKKGDKDAAFALARYTDRIARSLASVVNILDPDVIVLGGGMSNVDALYGGIPAIWDKYIISDTCDTPIVQARHGDSSGVRGAAWLWNAQDAEAQSLVA